MELWIAMRWTGLRVAMKQTNGRRNGAEGSKEARRQTDKRTGLRIAMKRRVYKKV